MRTVQLLFCLFILSLFTLLWSQNYQINRSVISSGGTINSSAGNLVLSGTLGEPVVGIMSDGQYQLSSGFWSYVSVVDGIQDETFSLIPKVYELNQNYPNPFNPVTRIKYALPYPSQVKIEIYNVLGIRVKTLTDEKQVPGYYIIEWSGKNSTETLVSSGLYFYRIIAQSEHGELFVQTKKMIFLK
jgi:hypothetical protein